MHRGGLTVCVVQRHLTDSEVLSAFKMTRAEFEKLPAWKQRNARQAAGLW